MDRMDEAEAAKKLLQMSTMTPPAPPSRAVQPPPAPKVEDYNRHAKDDSDNHVAAKSTETTVAVATKPPPPPEVVSSPDELSPSDHQPMDIISSAANGVEIFPTEQPTGQRKSGRKRIRKINYNTDSTDSDAQPDITVMKEKESPKKGTRRNNSTKTTRALVPVNALHSLDKELLSKLPNSPATNYFEEESAWRFHNPAFPSNSLEQLTMLRDESTIPFMSPAVSSEELQPLPSPPPLPQFPSTGFCQWTFDETSRVLYAKFEQFRGKKLFGQVMVNPEDECFLLRMMERDDITVISEGLADEIDASLWTREYITGCIGSEYHHKFRAFQKKTRTVTTTKNSTTKTIEYHEEQSGWYSMKVSSYFDYLEKRRSVQCSKQHGEESDGENDGSEKMFRFEDSKGKKHCINAEEVSLVSLSLLHVNVFRYFFFLSDLRNCTGYYFHFFAVHD